MLYTRSDGERMIRVFNYHWTVSKNLYSYFKSTDVEALVQFKMRQELTLLNTMGAKELWTKFQTDLVDMLFQYRKQCAAQTNPT